MQWDASIPRSTPYPYLRDINAPLQRLLRGELTQWCWDVMLPCKRTKIAFKFTDQDQTSPQFNHFRVHYNTFLPCFINFCSVFKFLCGQTSGAATAGVVGVPTLPKFQDGVFGTQNFHLPCDLKMKFVVCKPLQRRCHHSPEAYFSPQKWMYRNCL